jgi:hypothetical protein
VFYNIPASPAAIVAVNRGRPLVADGAAATDLVRAYQGFVEKVTGAKASVAKSA